VRVPFAITLRNCSIPEVIELTSTTIGTLDLSGSYTGPIHASFINVADNLVLGNGFHAAGQVVLSRAKVGLLSATAGHFRYSPELGDLLPDLKVALILNGAKLKFGALMDRGFESQGAVSSVHTVTESSLDLTSGRFINPGNDAIFAPGAEIGGSVYVFGEKPWPGAARPFEANGRVYFENVRVQGEFLVDGARFFDTGSPSGNGGLDGLDLEVRSGFSWRRVSLENGAKLRLR
jgi:hypothetical protein